MVDHKVHNDLNASFFRLPDESVHILHRPVLRMDGIIVADVVTVIILRRLINRRKPDDIDSQLFQIAQSADNARDISDSVTI